MNHILLDITKHLNQEFQITPVLYASFAYEKVTTQDVNAHDIDLLIPHAWMMRRNDIIHYLEQHGYIHQEDEVIAFEKDQVRIELADLENWVNFCKLDVSELHTVVEQKATYQMLGANNLLKLYRYLSTDEKRSSHKKAHDFMKIASLEDVINKESCRYR